MNSLAFLCSLFPFIYRHLVHQGKYHLASLFFIRYFGHSFLAFGCKTQVENYKTGQLDD